jgi:tetratricopeptide (TPR) repeat protein
MSLESQSPEHAITLPLVSKDREDPRLPLVIDVVARYWGEDLAPANTDAGPSPPRASALISGIHTAESKGLAAYIYKGSVKDLKKRIDQGIPPIVIVPGIQGIVQHALIVSGYNEEERRILTYVAEPDTVGAIPETKFVQDWNQDEMTTIVLVPGDMKDLMENENLEFRQSNRMCFEAEGLRQQKDNDGAISKLLTAIQIDKNNAQAWGLLAGIYNDLGDEEAQSCYQKAISLNPRYYLAFRGLGNYFLKKEDYSAAEEYYTKAVAINPNRFGPIYKNRAIARMQLGNNEGAKEDLKKYLEQVPHADDRLNIEQAIAEL